MKRLTHTRILTLVSCSSSPSQAESAVICYHCAVSVAPRAVPFSPRIVEVAKNCTPVQDFARLRSLMNRNQHPETCARLLSKLIAHFQSPQNHQMLHPLVQARSLPSLLDLFLVTVASFVIEAGFDYLASAQVEIHLSLRI